MRVDTPTLLAVLAHEIRSPVSVLQGYLRLLEQQRPAAGAEGPMLEAMRKSTARLAALGREASDLSTWLGTGERSDPASVTVHDLIGDLQNRTSLAITAPLPRPIAESALQTPDLAMLGRALAALVVAVSRDHDNTACQVDVGSGERLVVVRIRPGRDVHSQPAIGGSDVPSEARRGAAPAFNRSGMGLELVLASHVLDSHAARVSTVEAGGVDVFLPRQEARR
jgi:hypothetical protein